MERIDEDFGVMLGLAAQMQECDEDKFVFAAQQDYRLGAEKITEFDKHIYLAMKRVTAGIAREIVDTSKTAGEAWCRVTDRFYGKNVQGATATAGQFQELKRLSQIAESFHSLNVIKKLVKEFALQSPKEPMPSAIVKAAYMNVVPETYRRALETQVDVGEVELSTFTPASCKVQGARCKVQTCKAANLQNCKPEKLQSCKTANLQSCKTAKLQTCKAANLQG